MPLLILFLLFCTPVLAQETKVSLDADIAQAVSDIAAIELEKAPLVEALVSDVDAIALGKLKAKADAIKVKDDAIKAKQAIIADAEAKIYAIDNPVVAEEPIIAEEEIKEP